MAVFPFRSYNVRVQLPAARLAALAALAAALVALPGGVAQAAFPGTNGLVAFERGADIYTVTTDGTPTVSASPLVSNGSDPAWSADGKKLAYVEAGTTALKVLTVGGSTTGALDTGAASPVFSPDGTMLAYVKGTDIWVVAVAGGAARNLSNSGAGADDSDPTWAADNSKIAFARVSSGNSDIWTMDAPTSASSGGGSNQQALTSAASNETQPTFAPGSGRVAYTTDRHGTSQIYSIATFGGSETRVTNSATADSQPAYAPDGVRIAFARAGSGITTIDGALTTNAADADPDWQPAAPSNTSAPVISGNASDGGTLFASTGTFAGSATSYAYQWLRCDADGNSCSDLSGATSSTYRPTSADVGRRLRVRVTATGSSGSSSATSAASDRVASANPANTVAPKVVVFATTGVPQVGQTLSSSVGTWTGAAPITYTHQWKKCQPKDGPCFRILTPAAGASTFVPTGDLIGWSLRVEVTATNASGSSTAQSESTPLVVGNPPVNVVRPKVSVFATNPSVGQDLKVDTGTWTGLVPLAYAYEWRRCDPPGTLPSCKPIPGADEDTYTTTEADLGLTLRAYVTATNAGGSSTAFSDHTFPTVPAPRLAPATTTLPALTGEVELGGLLTASRGTWTGFAPIRYVAVWQRCDATLAVCRAVKGAKGLSYRISEADLGWRLRLSVVAVNAIGSLRVRSEATEPIALGPPKPKGRRLVGTQKPNYLPGGGGDDVLIGLGGADTLMGGKGDDRLDGGAGNDLLDGGPDRDRISAGPGSDTVLAVDGEIDRIGCGAGNDRVVADPIDIVDADCELVTRSSPAPSETR